VTNHIYRHCHRHPLPFYWENGKTGDGGTAGLQAWERELSNVWRCSRHTRRAKDSSESDMEMVSFVEPVVRLHSTIWSSMGSWLASVKYRRKLARAGEASTSVNPKRPSHRKITMANRSAAI